MFKGTEKYGPGVFQQTVQALGGTDNAFTSLDYTAYTQRIAADRLEEIMQLEADRMHGLLLTEVDIETERKVVLEERHTRTDTSPSSLLYEQMQAALFLNHPYGQPIIGWRHEIETLSREDIFEFYRQHYGPNNAVLIIAGDVEPEEVYRLAVKHYGGLEANPAITERVRPQEPPHLAPRRLILEDERVSNPYVIRRYLAAERNSGDQRPAAALSLLSALMAGDGVNSYLKQKLEIEQEIAIYTDAFYTSTVLDRQSFGFVVMPKNPAQLEEAEAALDAALEEFINGRVDEKQLARIKKSLHASRIYEQDSVQSVARRIGNELIIGLSLQDIEEWPDILQKITPEEIIEAAVQLIEPKNSVTGWAVNTGSDS